MDARAERQERKHADQHRDRAGPRDGSGNDVVE